MESSSTSGESQQQQQQQTQVVKDQEYVHKTKVIQFLGRTTPIVLQNENGPCPLLAICNVLLLRNNLNLGPDTAEVSQEKLLSLVAERLIDSNTNVNNKEAGYVENQQQNIADAIDLLPRLATGIDVNIKFRRIDDFEFTPECAIFDLLDIPLYHGWIVDPQDDDTASAINAKSYNTLMEELVALDTTNVQSSSKNDEEDFIDFAAATTATLGVPSPSLSKAQSFDDSPRSVSDEQKVRKGDIEEEAELLRALKLSEAETPASMDNHPIAIVNTNGSTGSSVHLDESTPREKVVLVDTVVTEVKQNGVENDNLNQPGSSISDGCDNCSISTLNTGNGQVVCPTDLWGNHLDQSLVECEGRNFFTHVVEKSSREEQSETENALTQTGKEGLYIDENFMNISQGDHKDQSLPSPVSDVHRTADKQSGSDVIEVSCLSTPVADSDSSTSKIQLLDESEGLTTSIDDSEPMYEGEECILDREATTFEDHEPVYEGEVILAEQACNTTLDASNINPKEDISRRQGEFVRNFLKNTASQLTIYGLFCLQDGLKERELCVFFRNNHFSTMFKFDGQLYLLATDQGYINQPDLVWERLNEVNGDTLFMTGNFKEFKVESHANETWDEHNAMASTADYLASIDSATQAGFDMNSDLQLAIALQQQEFEQQPQRQNGQQQQQQPFSGSSRLVTGPQVARNNGRNTSSSSTLSRPEAKSKDKCTVM